MKNKLYSTIKAAGLSTGLACAILIYLWVYDELTYDQYHPNIESIYQVLENQEYSTSISTTYSTPGILSPYLKETYPQLEFSTRATWIHTSLFQIEESSYYEQGRFVDADFLKIFKCEFIYGDPENPLPDEKSIILTQELASKYFPGINPIGNVIVMSDKHKLTVSGVIKSWPKNTSYGGFNYLVNFDFYFDINKSWLSRWDNNSIHTIVKIPQKKDAEEFEKQIKRLLDEKKEENSTELFLQPFTERHLYSDFDDGVQSGGQISQVKSFVVIGLFILLIASINYMNLAAAVAIGRGKEAGLRKVVGASKGTIILQFLVESLLFAMVSGGIAIMLVHSTIPLLNELTNKSISLNLDLNYLLTILIFIVLSGLLGGLYPALQIASFKPVQALKETLKSGKSSLLVRKSLMIIQFVLSIILIFSTLIVHRQLTHLKNKEVGFSMTNLIYFRMYDEMYEKKFLVKELILNNPDVQSVTLLSLLPLNFSNSTTDFNWSGKGEGEKISFRTLSVDSDYIKTFNIDLLAGRSFDSKLKSDSNNFIVNEKAANAMGFSAPEAVGKSLTYDGREGNIVGVVRNFNYDKAKYSIEPLIFGNRSKYFHVAAIKVKEGAIQKVLPELDDLYQEFTPAYPFEYFLVEDKWGEFYEDEQQTASLLNSFSLVAIFISCLGLFGLTAFATTQKSKEIGIRKVLGATVPSIMIRITKEFFILVIIASLLAIPIAWFYMDKWLQDFAFRVEIGILTPLISLLLAFLVALATTLYHSIKVANMNPVKAIRNE